MVTPSRGQLCGITEMGLFYTKRLISSECSVLSWTKGRQAGRQWVGRSVGQPASWPERKQFLSPYSDDTRKIVPDLIDKNPFGFGMKIGKTMTFSNGDLKGRAHVEHRPSLSILPISELSNLPHGLVGTRGLPRPR